MLYLEQLKKPFEPFDIEWRIQQSGLYKQNPWARVLAYIQARAAQDRFDAVCGAENWAVEYKHEAGGIMCGISVLVPQENGHSLWITKWDGAEPTEIEAYKGGISSAFKRTASVWGVGRYLYNLEAGFATFVEKKQPGAMYCKIQEQPFYWIPPELPKWALPDKKEETKDGIRPTTQR